MSQTLNATYANQWRKISTTKTVTLALKGWRKWAAILLRRPVTYDVEMTGSAWIKGAATIELRRSGYLSVNPLTSDTLIFSPQTEWKGGVKGFNSPTANLYRYLRQNQEQ